VEESSSGAEIELKEEKVYVHLDEEKERDIETCVLDTGRPTTYKDVGRQSQRSTWWC
jgi:hypothetical protein